jgi:Protein of unknown function (DUF2510)
VVRRLDELAGAENSRSLIFSSSSADCGKLIARLCSLPPELSTMMNAPQPEKRRSRRAGGGRRGWPLFFYGLAFFAIGLVVTVGTYAAAANGGHYLISFGPMVVGVVAMVRGLIDVARLRRAEGQQPGAAAYQWAPSTGALQPGVPAPAGVTLQPGVPAPAGVTLQPGVPTPASVTQQMAANWYADPQDALKLRWWDGQAWTGHTRPRY